ncbi:MAG: hypothetical protein AB7V13_21120 [Pseudorhodoplanes sp.]|uniref:hypothetical protein n=1 Tax=Pseudorhodoplanes sp. TaxID=1934341 RepID=UPI003D09FFBD
MLTPQQHAAIAVEVSATYAKMGRELGEGAAKSHRAAGLSLGLSERMAFKTMLDDAIGLPNGIGSKATPDQVEAYKVAFWKALSEGMQP